MSAGQKPTPFVRAFYIANFMEVFERLAWYGFFAVSSIYMTTPLSEGGLGLTDAQRGALQGIVPFLLYLFPVITGALADHFGYRRMFILAFCLLCPGYYLLGQVTSFSLFFLIFVLVALGGAIFKPVVVGTVARTTDQSNRALGFGIFYTIVNVGGFLGPLVAGYVRSISWDLVFVMSSFWILVNFVPAIFFYKEPAAKSETTTASLTEALKGARQVLGNGRLALLVAPLLIALMLFGGGWISAIVWSVSSVGWLLINWLWSRFVAENIQTHELPWFRQKLSVGNGYFIGYLLVLSLFWAAYNQIFYTLPLYIKDFVDTADIVASVNNVSPALAHWLASVNPEQIQSMLSTHLPEASTSHASLIQLQQTLLDAKIRVPVDAIAEAIGQFNAEQLDISTLSQQWARDYRQVNPEYILAVDFGSILVFQVLISRLAKGFKTFNVLIVGTLLIALAYLLTLFTVDMMTAGYLVAFSVFLFALGEMLASPKSQEYVASIAPHHQSALYMGYYFVSMALGFLFAGLLSGWGYGYIAKSLQRPDLMWALFAGLGIVAALALLLFNRFNQNKSAT